MIEAFSKNLFRREVLEYGARCSAALAAVMVDSLVAKKTDEFWNKQISNFLTDQLILEAFLFRSDVSRDAANSMRLCSFALRAIAAVVNSKVKGRLPEKLSPQLNSLNKKVASVISALFTPFTILMDYLPSERLKNLTQAVGVEILFGGLLQEALLRQLPKYVFTATQLCSAEIVDSLPARVVRVAICALVVGIGCGGAPFNFVESFLYWGDGSGYLTEAVGFAPAAIQAFAVMLRIRNG